MKPGATLADREGKERIAWLDRSCLNVQLQILQHQRNTLTMQQEAAQIREGTP